ncbi:MAG TPA: PKD domain-containing protein, partial [Chitinophagaceae bacterium]
TVSAGSTQTITLPTNSASLSGTAAGTNGATISTYAWTQLSGPSTAGMSSPGLIGTNVTGLIAGSYTFTLTVTDNHGLTNSSNVTVNVNPANTPPTVSAGSNQTITLPTNSASLSGTAAGTNGATISTYAWTQLSGPSTAGISSSGLSATNVTGLVAGSYTFTLTVTDNNGLTNSSNVTVNVNTANTAPTVSAGSNQTITLPVNSASLSGTASGTGGATISNYTWTQASGPSTAGISSPGLAGTNVTGLIAGSYSFTLTVTDNNGLTNSANVTVTVNPANTAPTVSAGSNQTITLPTNSASLSGTASGTGGATISNYTWTQASGPSTAGISSPGLSGTNVTGLIAGSYTFTLTVTDNNGLTNSSNVTVTVNLANTAPTVSAGSNQTITLPTNSASLSGTAAGTNGATISTYAWTQLSGPSTAGISSSGLIGTNVTGLIAGSYTFTLTVTDNNGLTNSSNVTVTVNPANTAPTVSAGSNQTITLPVNSASLSGTAAGTNGATISTYAWTQLSGPSTAGISSPGLAGTNVTGLIAGSYTFTLTVTDNNGLTNGSNVTVTVNPANTAPTVSAGSNQTITLPVNSASLSGTAAGTNGATISTYAWTQLSGPSTAGISSPGLAGTNVTGLIEGSYTFTLTVTDNNGLINSSNVTVTVNPAPNVSPVAIAGNDMTIYLPQNTVILDGSDSYDPDGSIASYSWNKVSGPGSLTILNPTTAKPTIIGLNTGVFVFELTVTDNSGSTATSRVQVTVYASTAHGPKAVTAGDTSIALPASIAILNGARSWDSSGTITNYSWTQVSGPAPSGILNATASASAVTNLVEGQYVFMLTITDNNGATDTATMKVTVVDAFRYTQYFKIYPNPVQSTLSLQYIDDKTGRVKLTIMDESGRLVLTQEFVKSQSLLTQQLNVSNLGTGVYFLSIQQSDGTKLIRRFVKQ